jgi:hypothetical protein
MAYLIPISVVCNFKCADSNDIYTGASLSNQVLTGVKYENTESAPVEWSPLGELQLTDGIWYYIPTEGERSQEYHYMDLHVFADEIASPSIVEITLEEGTDTSCTENCNAIDSASATISTTASIIENCNATDSSVATKDAAASITESCSSSDLSSAATVTNASITENCSASDESDGIVGNFAGITESASAVDSQSAIVSFQASIVENASANDSSAATRNTSASISESATASDYQSSFAVRPASITESANATDSCDATVVAGGASIVESANATDSCSATVVFAASIVENANAIDICSSSDVVASYSTDPYLIVASTIIDRVVNETDVIKFGTRSFEILTIENVQERNFETFISCKERR